MWNKIKTIVVTVLATLGVLFIILMLIPDDEEGAVEPEIQETQVLQESRDVEEDQEITETQEVSQVQETEQPQEYMEEISSEDFES